MSLDGGSSSRVEGVVLSVKLAMKNRIPAADGLEILILDPAIGLVGMTPFSPSPERFEDGMVNRVEYHLADHMAVVVCPTTNDGIEQYDQCASTGLSVGLDDLANLCEEGMDTLLGRSDE